MHTVDLAKNVNSQSVESTSSSQIEFAIDDADCIYRLIECRRISISFAIHRKFSKPPLYSQTQIYIFSQNFEKKSIEFNESFGLRTAAKKAMIYYGHSLQNV